MAALAAAAVVATATVGAVPVERAIAPATAAVVQEVKSLQVELTSYDPFYPYVMPLGPVGVAITLPLSIATAIVQQAADGVSALLTQLHVDPRLAQQPSVIVRSLLVPLAVSVQVPVVTLLGGSNPFGNVTPAQALDLFRHFFTAAIDGFGAAERDLFGLPSAASVAAMKQSQLTEAPVPGAATADTADADGPSSRQGNAHQRRHGDHSAAAATRSEHKERHPVNPVSRHKSDAPTGTAAAPTASTQEHVSKRGGHHHDGNGAAKDHGDHGKSVHKGEHKATHKGAHRSSK